MSIKQFSKVQFGKETTRGTAVAADTLLLGQTQPITQDRKPTFPVEQFGVRSESLRAVTHQYLVQRSLVSEHGYFQLLPVLFGCGLKGGVTAAEQNTGVGDYLWAFAPSETAANAPDSLTIEEGDDTQAYEAEYCMFEGIHISGQVAQGAEASPVNISADYFGRQWTETTFTGSISAPAATAMNAKLARLYIDTAWAGVGGTEKANVLRSFTVDILTGVHPGFAGAANEYFNAYKEGLTAIMATFTLERGAISDAIWDAMKANTFQVVRLAINGPAIGAGDSHNLSIDIGGYWETVQPMASEDRGNSLDTVAIKGVYDSTGAKKMDVNVTTNVSAY